MSSLGNALARSHDDCFEVPLCSLDFGDRSFDQQQSWVRRQSSRGKTTQLVELLLDQLSLSLLRLELRLDRHMTITADYAHFFAGDFLKQTTPGKDVDYLSVWLTYRF